MGDGAERRGVRRAARRAPGVVQIAWRSAPHRVRGRDIERDPASWSARRIRRREQGACADRIRKSDVPRRRQGRGRRSVHELRGAGPVCGDRPGWPDGRLLPRPGRPARICDVASPVRRSLAGPELRQATALSSTGGEGRLRSAQLRGVREVLRACRGARPMRGRLQHAGGRGRGAPGVRSGRRRSDRGDPEGRGAVSHRGLPAGHPRRLRTLGG